MKKGLFAALSALVFVVASCYNDKPLNDRIDDLEGRVSTLEEKVKELNDRTVPGIQATVAALQANVYVTSVSGNDNDGYPVVFSNGATAHLSSGKDGAPGADGKPGSDGTPGADGKPGVDGKTPVIGAKEVDGVFYWTVNGEVLVDTEGNKVAVHAAAPIFKIVEGKWNISYDGGETWAEVPLSGTASGGSTVSITDGETEVTFYIDGTPYVIKKESSFCLVFEQRADIGAAVGATATVPFTISGAAAGDEVEVDILNVIGDWTASVTMSDNTTGTLSATNNSGGNGKVFVYAANGKGKTDIKSVCFEDGVLSAVAEVSTFDAEGGQFTVSVTTNTAYTVSISNGGAAWISEVPETRAAHLETRTYAVAANTGVTGRSATFSVLDLAGTSVYSVDIIQKGTGSGVTAYEDYIGTWVFQGRSVTISQKENGVSYTISNFVEIGSSYGASEVEATYDPVTGNLVVMEQALSTYTHSTYGQCINYISGIYLNGETRTRHYGPPSGTAASPVVLFVANINADGCLDCQPGYTEGGDVFVGFEQCWVIQEGSSAGNGNVRTKADLPLQFLSIVPTAAYQAWFGDWEVPKSSGSFTINISQGTVPNANFTVTGWQGYQIEAEYDYENNQVVFYSNTNKNVAEGMSVTSGGVTYTCSYCFIAVAQKTETTTVSITGRLAAITASLNDDGSASLTGNNITLTDGSVVPVLRIGLRAVSTDGTNKTFTMSGYHANCPITMTRPSTEG